MAIIMEGKSVSANIKAGCPRNTKAKRKGYSGRRFNRRRSRFSGICEE